MAKIIWDWLKYGRSGASKNGSKGPSMLTAEVAHLKETCNLKHKTEDERHTAIDSKTHGHG